MEEDIHHDYCHQNIDGDEAVAVTVESYLAQQQSRIAQGLSPQLYHDATFRPIPSSIDGINRHKDKSKTTKKTTTNNNNNNNATNTQQQQLVPAWQQPPPKCRCHLPT